MIEIASPGGNGSMGGKSQWHHIPTDLTLVPKFHSLPETLQAAVDNLDFKELYEPSILGISGWNDQVLSKSSGETLPVRVV